jgi:homeobox protein ESX1
MPAMAVPPPDATSATVPVAPAPAAADAAKASPSAETAKRPREIGGPKGPEPTRYGDWERNGRVSDF